MILQRTIFPVFLLLGCSFHSVSQTKALFDADKLKNYINVINVTKGFNGEVLVAKDSVILFQQTIGLSSVENNLTLQNGAKYRIASISKTFTGTLIAMAQDENKLNVRDKAIDLVDGLSTEFNAITIEQLLTHTSGLPHNEGIADYWQTKSKLQMATPQVIAEINSLKLLFKPGSEMHYSSLGYYLLATILEKVYKDDFQNILQTKILDKLRMTETGSANTLKIIPQMTSGYHLVQDDSLVVAPYRNYSMLKGAGDMYTNVSDLLKWNNSFFSNTLLNDETKALIFSKPKNVFKNNGVNYGYGWYIGTEKPIKYYHGGGTWGYSSNTAFYPNEKISIIILSNVSTLPITSIASDVEKIVFGKPFEIPPIEKVVSIENIDLEIYCGQFISEANNMQLSITKSGNSLYAKLAGRPPFEIYPKGNHVFFGKKAAIDFTFDIKNDLLIGLKADGMGKSFYFNKENK